MIDYTKQALDDLSKLKKMEPNAYKKAKVLLSELEEHPRTGTGQIELLRHCEKETFSRRLDKSIDLYIKSTKKLL